MTLRSLFVDFNSYFASVEQQLDPSLRGRPIAVVPVLAETTCCIAASIEAKQFGIKTGTAVHDARNLCPGIAIVQAQPRVYVEFHHALKAAIEDCIPIHSVGSIDEMECRLIGKEQTRKHAITIAEKIKASVYKVGDSLRCSIGIAPNGFLAKTASDMQKPDGLVVIEQAQLPDALFCLKLNDLCGVGYQMEKRLRYAGIHSIEQLCFATRAKLREVWGSIEGERFFDRLHGEIVETSQGARGTVGHSHVLSPEFRNTAGVNAVLKKLLMKAAMRLRSYYLLSGMLHVRVKYIGADAWEQSLRIDHTDDSSAFLHYLIGLIKDRKDQRKPLAVSVTLTHLIAREGTCASLFSATKEKPAINILLDKINGKYGNNKIYFGGLQQALSHAPMRISFNQIPDVAMEDESEHNDLFAKRMNQFRVLAEATHKSRQQHKA
jgi:DNA polymerase IV